MTQDEKLMIKLYELAMKAGDPHMAVEAKQAARVIGIKDTALKTIIKSLAQANLVKKIDDTTVSLTPRGCEFVLDMRGG